MDRLNVINAKNIFNEEEKKILTQLHEEVNLDKMVVEENKIVTNRKAYRKLKNQIHHREQIRRFAERLRLQFGSDVTLRVVRKGLDSHFILEKMNFN